MSRVADAAQGTFSLAVWTRWRNCCVCGDPGSNAHHVLRRSQGGDDVVANGVMLCGTGTMGCHGRFHGGNARTAQRIGEHIRDQRPDVLQYVQEKLGDGAEDFFRRIYRVEVQMSEQPEAGRVDAAKVVVFEDEAGFHWQASDTNGEVVADSGDDGYHDYAEARQAAEDLFPNARFGD